jgi:penicillin-binding protein 1A
MRLLQILVILLSIICSCALALFFFITQNNWIDFSTLESYCHGKPSIILDDTGKEWARFSFDRRQPVDITAVPQHLIQAFIAAEDHAFFNHPGISWKGILRSVLVNMYHGKVVQGASTITQQLVKLLFTDARRTLTRKIKDQFLALLVEQQFTKEHILQMYLNHICFGCGIYGVEAASQRFWGKHAQDLSLEESALLAAIVKNPTHYCPLLYPLSAQKRRNVVLHSMMQLGFMSREDYEKYCELPINLSGTESNCLAPHLKEMIRINLEERFGKKKLYTGGLLIQSTLSSSIQRQAEKSFHDQVILLRKGSMPHIDGGLITIDGKTGQIKALVGGFDFNKSQFNRVTQARRQMGSSFKPLVYAAAIEQGMDFSQTEIDEPIEIVQANQLWKPRNAIRTFRGEMTLAYALAHSNNIVSIKTLLKIGIDSVIKMARKFRLPEITHAYPSLALGCVDSTLKEVVGMFNVFAQQGTYVEPYFIRWVKDEWGTKLINHKLQKDVVLNSYTSGQVAKILSIGMDRARKKFGLKDWIQCEAIGKTGTTNDSRTCWFVGATPDFTTAAYLGNDDNTALGDNVFPISTVFPIWKSLHRELPITKKQFSFDPALKEITINAWTGELCAKNDRDALSIFV